MNRKTELEQKVTERTEKAPAVCQPIPTRSVSKGPQPKRWELPGEFATQPFGQIGVDGITGSNRMTEQEQEVTERTEKAPAALPTHPNPQRQQGTPTKAVGLAKRVATHPLSSRIGCHGRDDRMNRKTELEQKVTERTENAPAAQAIPTRSVSKGPQPKRWELKKTFDTPSLPWDPVHLVIRSLLLLLFPAGHPCNGPHTRSRPRTVFLTKAQRHGESLSNSSPPFPPVKSHPNPQRQQGTPTLAL